MIRNDTARQLMYDWHDGQWSAFYAAASSGLVADFDALLADCASINEKNPRRKLTEWIMHRAATCEGKTVNGQFYSVLPWYIERIKS